MAWSEWKKFGSTDLSYREAHNNLTTYTTPVDGYYSITSLNSASGYGNEITINGTITSLTLIYSISGTSYNIANGVFYLPQGTVIQNYNSSNFAVICYEN